MFNRNTEYPIWSSDNIENIPGRPTWEVEFSDYKISFDDGSKICYVNSRRGVRTLCGDYTVHITSDNLNWSAARYTDLQLWDNLLIPFIENNGDNFILKLRELLQITIEDDVLNNINSLNFCDELKVCLYTLWHRAIIEDRLYSSPYAGHKQVIGMTIAIIRKLQNQTFANSERITFNPLRINVDLRCNECNGWYQL